MDITTLLIETVSKIEEDLKSISSVNSLSIHLGYSKTYINRVFSRVLGYSVLDYIKMRKITEGIHCFKTSNRNIVDIAFEYGFNSHEVFIRNCKRYFRSNPGVIINNKNWKGLPVLTPDQILFLTSDGKITEKLVKLPELILQESKTGNICIMGSGFRGIPSTLKWDPSLTYKFIPKGVYISFRTEKDEEILVKYIEYKYPHCKTIIQVNSGLNSIYYIKK